MGTNAIRFVQKGLIVIPVFTCAASQPKTDEKLNYHLSRQLIKPKLSEKSAQFDYICCVTLYIFA